MAKGKNNQRKTFTLNAMLHTELSRIKLDLQEKAVEAGITNRITFDDVIQKLVDVYNDYVKGIS